ncbi:hypothetical protein FQR65_LT14371 [Abscondita terminalis]|nr:hypothetical protein FQR65_LT14371 [Abscondita terminalis]
MAGDQFCKATDNNLVLGAPCLRTVNSPSHSKVAFVQSAVPIRTPALEVDSTKPPKTSTRTEDNLICISTDEIRSKNIQDSLLTAREKGEENLRRFIEIVDSTSFYKPIKKINLLKERKQLPASKDRIKRPFQGQEFLQQLLAAKEIGRNIDYQEVFKHELTQNPMTLAPIVSDDTLVSDHEEADIRILLHILSAKRPGYERCIIDCSDTDVLVLLEHCSKVLTKEIWMKTGREENIGFIAVHEITLNSALLNNLPAFYAITGCDSTSQFTGIEKNAWKVYLTLNRAAYNTAFAQCCSFVVEIPQTQLRGRCSPLSTLNEERNNEASEITYRHDETDEELVDFSEESDDDIEKVDKTDHNSSS